MKKIEIMKEFHSLNLMERNMTWRLLKRNIHFFFLFYIHFKIKS